MLLEGWREFSGKKRDLRALLPLNRGNLTAGTV
jgi:hypothetical protein